MRTIQAVVTFLRPEEGGRRRPVVDSTSYRPHLVVEGQYLGVQFTGDGTILTAGEDHRVTLRLMYEVDYSALQPGTEFSVREGRRTVGTGRVL